MSVLDDYFNSLDFQESNGFDDDIMTDLLYCTGIVYGRTVPIGIPDNNNFEKEYTTRWYD